MGQEFRHFEFSCSPEQGDNFVKLGRYLVINRHTLAPVIDFGAMHWVQGAPMAGQRAWVPPLTLGPFAGIAALGGETVEQYVVRCFNVEPATFAEHWIEGFDWRKADPSPVGVALRMMYQLDYGTPDNMDQPIEDASRFDYAQNSFLWDRLKLVPPND